MTKHLKSQTATVYADDDSKNEQRIWWKADNAEKKKVDRVPFGGVEKPARKIAFPPEGDFVSGL